MLLSDFVPDKSRARKRNKSRREDNVGSRIRTFDAAVKAGEKKIVEKKLFKTLSKLLL